MVGNHLSGRQTGTVSGGVPTDLGRAGLGRNCTLEAPSAAGPATWVEVAGRVRWRGWVQPPTVLAVLLVTMVSWATMVPMSLRMAPTAFMSIPLVGSA